MCDLGGGFDGGQAVSALVLSCGRSTVVEGQEAEGCGLESQLPQALVSLSPSLLVPVPVCILYWVALGWVRQSLSFSPSLYLCLFLSPSLYLSWFLSPSLYLSWFLSPSLACWTTLHRLKGPGLFLVRLPLR